MSDEIEVYYDKAVEVAKAIIAAKEQRLFPFNTENIFPLISYPP